MRTEVKTTRAPSFAGGPGEATTVVDGQDSLLTAGEASSSDLPVGDEPPAERSIRIGRPGAGSEVRVYFAGPALEFVRACGRRAGEEACAGVLLGCPLRSHSGRPFVLVDAAIESPEVEAASRSVKVPARAFAALREAAADPAFAGRRIVGWFHARPGEPMELSPYETFVHTTHFGAPWQFALVLDPASGRETIWVWSGQTVAQSPGCWEWDAPARPLWTREDVRRAGYFSGAAQEASAVQGPAAGWERGTWPVSRAQERLAERQRQATRPSADGPWPRVARLLQVGAVLVVVFAGAVMARWALDRVWPGLFRGGQEEAAVLPDVSGTEELGASSSGADPASHSAPPGSQEIMGGVPGRTPSIAGQPPVAFPDVPRRPEGPEGAGSPAPARASGDSGTSGASQVGATYLVRPGDTLWELAERFYGDGDLSRWLAEANGIPDPGRIVPGQRVALPPRGDQAASGK